MPAPFGDAGGVIRCRGRDCAWVVSPSRGHEGTNLSRSDTARDHFVRIDFRAKPALPRGRRSLIRQRLTDLIASLVVLVAFQIGAARPLTSAPDVASLVARARAARLQQDAQLPGNEVSH